MSVPKLKRAQLRERKRESGAQCDQLRASLEGTKLSVSWPVRLFGFVCAFVALAPDSVRHRSQNVFVRCADNILAVTKRGRCVPATYVCLVCVCVCVCRTACVCVCAPCEVLKIDCTLKTHKTQNKMSKGKAKASEEAKKQRRVCGKKSKQSEM